MPKTKTNEEFKKEVYNLVGNEYIFLEEYDKSSTKILCRHNKCGYEWKITPNHFLRGNRCVKCAIEKSKLRMKTNKEFKKEVYDKYGNDFLEEYKGSRIPIKCKCNKCNHEFLFAPEYIKRLKCPNCYKRRPIIKRSNKSMKKEVYNLVGNEYEFLEKYKGNQIKILCRHNKCSNEFYMSPYDFIEYNKRCPKCIAKTRKDSYRKSTEKFKKEVYNKFKDKIIILGEYYNNKKRILCKCNKCNYKWKVAPNNLIVSNGCPNCSGLLRKTYDEIKYEVENNTNFEYELIEADNYKNIHSKFTVRHKECENEFKTNWGNFVINESRCPFCSTVRSKGEEKINKWLENNNIKFERQFSFNDCIYISKLRFDFMIYNTKNEIFCLIEYDGMQHFNKYANRCSSTKDKIKKFKYIKARDKVKDKYCKENNIYLLRIPYTKYKQIDKILTKEILDYI